MSAPSEPETEKVEEEEEEEEVEADEGPAPVLFHRSFAAERAKRLYHELYDEGVPTVEQFCKRYAVDPDEYKGTVLCHIKLTDYRSSHARMWELISREHYDTLRLYKGEVGFGDLFGKHSDVRARFSECVTAEEDPEKIAEFFATGPPSYYIECDALASTAQLILDGEVE